MRNHFIRILGILLLFTTVAEAQIRRRPFARPAGESQLSGKLTDSISGLGVFEGEICIGERVIRANKEGEYNIKDLKAGLLTIKVGRWGYVRQILNVSLQPGANTLNVALAPKPVALLTDHSGLTYRVDAETLSFDSWFPLASPEHMDPLIFCQAGGAAREIPVAAIKSINGPGVSTRLAGCTESGDSVRVSLTLRSGEVVELYFPEANFYLFVLSAHDRDDGRWHYARFTEIEELELP